LASRDDIGSRARGFSAAQDAGGAGVVVGGDGEDLRGAVFLQAVEHEVGAANSTSASAPVGCRRGGQSRFCTDHSAPARQRASLRLVDAVEAGGTDAVDSAWVFAQARFGRRSGGWRENAESTASVPRPRRHPTSRSDAPLPCRSANGRYKNGFALLVLHPTGADADVEFRPRRPRAQLPEENCPPQILTIAPTTTPAPPGILRCWKNRAREIQYHRDLPRSDFLGLLREAAFLIGNSSSGINRSRKLRDPRHRHRDRQKGRERSANVLNVPFEKSNLFRANRKQPGAQATRAASATQRLWRAVGRG